MKHRLLRLSSSIAALAFIVVFFGLAIANTPTSIAVKATDFKAGRIIDDNVFYNPNTMTVGQIQNFMDNTLPACDMWGAKKIGYGYYIKGEAINPNITRAEYAKLMRTKGGDSRYHAPPYVCINKYYENPTTHVNNFSTNGEIKNGMISAAQIIYDAAQKYNINPQVLLVMLKKESYAWGDDWPTKNEFNTVMGYACPDNAACNTKYYGFYNQVNMAAWQLNYYKQHIYSYNYRPYTTNKIQYSPTASCGSKQVYIENYATASLYIYTPYTPNTAALKNYPGTASCGSYGNRNFFMYFSEWFGSTLFTAKTTDIVDGDYYIFSQKDGSLYLRANKATNVYSLSYDKLISGDLNSIFKIKRNADNTYSIINSELNVAIDAGITPEEGKVVTVSAYDEKNDAQKWVVYSNDTNSYSFSPLKNKSVALTYDSVAKKNILTTYTKADWQKIGVEKTLTTTTSTSTENKPAPTTATTPATPTTPVAAEPKKEENKIPSQVLDEGIYSFVSTINYTSAISLSGDKTANNTNTILWPITNKPSQKYSIQYDKNTGYYRLKNLLSNKYLSAKTTTIKNGVLAVIRTKADSCNQQWKITKNKNSSYTFTSVCNDSFALDVTGGKSAKGTKIQLYKNNGAKSQKFTLIKYEGDKLNGQYHIKSNTNPNYAIDVSGGKFVNERNVQLYKNNKSAAQKFTIKYLPSCDCYKIYTANKNYSIDVHNNKTANGTNIQIYKNDSTKAQRWYITKYMDGTYRIRNIGSYKMLNLNANIIKNGTNIHLWQDGNANSQKWKLERIQ